jgi:hypothetical protein
MAGVIIFTIKKWLKNTKVTKPLTSCLSVLKGRSRTGKKKISRDK